MDSVLSEYQPGSDLHDKLTDLIQYNVVQERLEFDVAREVVGKLEGVKKRLSAGTLAFTLLLRSKPSPTAVKYLERAAFLYLAGYQGETLIMCGAVLEAAVSTRFPDGQLRREGMKPHYTRSGVFSLGQRMQYEEGHPVLSPEWRDWFWKVINWRNDAVHVQPDLGPEPGMALVFTAQLLAILLPRDSKP